MNDTFPLDEILLIRWFRTLNSWDQLWLMYWVYTQDPITLLFLRSRLLNDDPHQIPQITPAVGRQ